MLNPKVYTKRFNTLLDELKAYPDGEHLEEQDAIIAHMICIVKYMERQGYILANTPAPYYFVPKEPQTS